MEGRKLVVFYSLDGNTRYIAEAIAGAVGADICELRPRQAFGAKGFLRYLWSGTQLMMQRSPELLPLEKSPAEYDIVFIGTPVWAFSYAAPLRSFFPLVRLQGKKIALFCCSGGKKGKVFVNMRNALAGNEIIGEIDFIGLRGKEQEAKRAGIWAKSLVA